MVACRKGRDASIRNDMYIAMETGTEVECGNFRIYCYTEGRAGIRLDGYPNPGFARTLKKLGDHLPHYCTGGNVRLQMAVARRICGHLRLKICCTGMIGQRVSCFLCGRSVSLSGCTTPETIPDSRVRRGKQYGRIQ